VVDGEELDLERPEPLALPLTHRERIGLDPPLDQFRLDQSKRELRADQRDVGLVGEQVGHRADVVFVTVGEHDRLHVVEPVDQRPEVRQDQVDAGLLHVGEQHAAVDDEQLAVVLEDGHVAADRPEPAERDHPQAAGRQRRGRLHVQVGIRHAGSSRRLRPVMDRELASWSGGEGPSRSGPMMASLRSVM
jgi:hypothetical protein